MDKNFEVMSFSRADLLEYFTKEEIDKLSDDDMKDIAENVANAFFDTVFWQTLKDVTEEVLEDK